MSGPIVKGWCPGALRPMESGDGLLVRIRPHMGRLSPEQGRAIACLASRFGNGQIELSSRAGLQIRGVHRDCYGDLLDGLTGVGLVDATPEAEARRNLTVAPFWQAGDDTEYLATELTAALVAGPQLPSKFGVALDVGERPVLARTSADIRVERADGGCFLVRADGALHGAAAERHQVVDAVLELAHWFLDSDGAPEGRGRMSKHLADGAVLPTRFTECSAQIPEQQTFEPGAHDLGWFVAPEFGRLTADGLTRLCESRCRGLRLTPWRMLLLEGVTSLEPDDAFIASNADPRLRVAVCSGAPMCAQAHGETFALARDLARHVPRHGALHVSGCAKGCAHPAPCDVTVVAAPLGYNVVVDGCAGDEPSKLDLTVAELVRELSGAQLSALGDCD